MDKSWCLLRNSFKDSKEDDIISGSSSSDPENYSSKRAKINNVINETSKRITSCSKTLQRRNRGKNRVEDDISDVSSDEGLDFKDTLSCVSPNETQGSLSFCTLTSQTAFAFNTEPKPKRKKFIKNGLAMKCQTLLNRQKSSMLLLNYTNANSEEEEDNSIELIIDKRTEEFGRTFIQCNDDLVVLTPQQAQKYNINDKLKVTNNSAFLSIKPLDTILNVYLNVCHIDLKNT